MHLKTKNGNHGDAWEQLICEVELSYMHRDFCILERFSGSSSRKTKEPSHCDSGPSFHGKMGGLFTIFMAKQVPQKMVSRGGGGRTFMPKHTDEER